MTIKKSILAQIEGADQKIDNLENRIKGFLDSRTDGLLPNDDIEILDEGREIVRSIDDILADIWEAFAAIVPLLEKVDLSSAGGPCRRCDDLKYPTIEYGIENKSASPIIEGVAQCFCEDDSLCEILNRLVMLSDKSDRKFEIRRQSISSFRHFGGGYAEPHPVPPTITIIRNDNASIENALLKAFSHAQSEMSVVGQLREIVTAIDDWVAVA